MKLTTLAVSLTLAAPALLPALSTAAPEAEKTVAAPAVTAANAASDASAETTLAEIKKIDKDAKKITLKHEEIKSLDMPPMTMVFQIKDNAMVEGLNAGDKVKFHAEKTKSGYAVSSIEAMK
jgi:Cu(I)/Ag(I) efflux system periplasmic protein CusF